MGACVLSSISGWFLPLLCWTQSFLVGLVTVVGCVCVSSLIFSPSNESAKKTYIRHS